MAVGYDNEAHCYLLSANRVSEQVMSAAVVYSKSLHTWNKKGKKATNTVGYRFILCHRVLQQMSMTVNLVQISKKRSTVRAS